MHLKGRWSGCLWQVKGVQGGAPFVMFGDGTEAGKVGWNWCWLVGTGSIYRFFWSHIVYCDYMVKTPYLYHKCMGIFIVFLISLLSTGSISLFLTSHWQCLFPIHQEWQVVCNGFSKRSQVRCKPISEEDLASFMADCFWDPVRCWGNMRRFDHFGYPLVN